MSIFTQPTVRVESAEGDSSPIEARLMTDGRIRIVTDPDSMSMNGTWLTTAEVREFVFDLLGLADASDRIYH